MAKKTLWITFWVTITLWLGGAFGCAAPGEDQNYKVMSDDNRTDIGTVDHTRRGESEGVVYVYDENDTDEPMADKQPDFPGNTLTTLDRSHWPVVYIKPIGGNVYHDPVYWRDFQTYKKPDYIVYPVSHPQYLDPALGEVKNGGWTSDNMLDIVAQPVKFGVDIVTFPVMIFIEPPFEKQQTP